MRAARPLRHPPTALPQAPVARPTLKRAPVHPPGQAHRPPWPLLAALAIPCLLAVAAPARAQTAPTTAPTTPSALPPDAGQVLRQTEQRPPAPPTAGEPLRLDRPATPAPVAPGGPTVRLRAVQFRGATVFSDEHLQALVADALQRPLDLAGLRALADRVTQAYRIAGYPFARALLPAQALDEGPLQIEVLEGRYGRISLRSGEPAWQTEGEAWLRPLQPGTPIRTDPLERVALLLGELPGVDAVAQMQPGEAVGTGDLVVTLARSARLNGQLSLDNQGSRYSGQHRLQLALEWLSPWRLGDQLSLRLLRAEQALWLGQLAYATPLPLADRSLRASAALVRTEYTLGKQFAALGASGTAEVASAGLSWAARRSTVDNLRVGLQWQHKRLRDRQLVQDETKHANTWPLTLDFDRRDAAAEHPGGPAAAPSAGGLTYGAFTWTPGWLTLGAPARARDELGTAGPFHRLNLDLVRQQGLGGPLSLWLRGSAQWASRNLDASERVSLGGPAGVRAYPNGEATGDQGWLLQTELRWQTGAWVPYLLADAGTVRLSTRPLATAADNQRHLAGLGAGLRWQQDSLDAQLSLAWRVSGGAAQADGGLGGQPRLWAQLAWRL